MTITTGSVVAMLTIVLAATGTGAGRAGPARSEQPLQRITSAEMTSAGVRGTGCSWQLGGERAARLVMIGDRALVKLAGRLVPLNPGPGALDMFPFTFDRWRRDDLGIVVRKLGPTRWIGTEKLGGRTDLTLVRSGRRTVLHGSRECGS